MAAEIEKKFLLNYFPENLVSEPVKIRQGYIFKKKQGVVRIRLAGDAAFITIKGPTRGCSRQEYEYALPIEDAQQILALFCKQSLIEKKRYHILYKGFVWEIDQFCGKNKGLIVAEIELEHESQVFDKPDWAGEEVTHDSRYFNSNLIDHPYSQWY